MLRTTTDKEWQMQKKQFYQTCGYREYFWELSQSESRIGPSSHVKFPNENLLNVEDYPGNIYTKVGSTLASGFVINILNCLKVMDNEDNDRCKVMKLPQLILCVRWALNPSCFSFQNQKLKNQYRIIYGNSHFHVSQSNLANSFLWRFKWNM